MPFAARHTGYGSGAACGGLRRGQRPGQYTATPLDLLQAPGDDRRWFVVEQAGTVRVFGNVETAGTASNFINRGGRVSPGGGETGLLGMAFHVDYNGGLYRLDVR